MNAQQKFSFAQILSEKEFVRLLLILLGLSLLLNLFFVSSFVKHKSKNAQDAAYSATIYTNNESVLCINDACFGAKSGQKLSRQESLEKLRQVQELEKELQARHNTLLKQFEEMENHFMNLQRLFIWP